MSVSELIDKENSTIHHQLIKGGGINQLYFLFYIIN